MTPPDPAAAGRPISTRRELLSRTAALAGAGAALGSRAFAAQDEPIPIGADRVPLGADEPVRVGLIGAGGMGGGHLSALMRFADEKLANLQIVAIGDVCKPRLDHWVATCTERGHAAQGYRDYRELLARDDLHGVVIASPEHWHAQMAVDAIVAGKDVYLEKPMTLRLEDAVRLTRVVHANDQILQVGTQQMMIPKFVEARRLLKEGAIGHPTLSQTSYCRNTPEGEWNYYGIDPQVEPGEMLDWDGWCGPLGARAWDTKVYHRWRRYKDFSTGIIGDLLVHVMTPMMYALDLGFPVRVTASGGHYLDHDMENHDQVFLNVEFEGHTMVVAGSTINDTGLETLIRGNRANMFLAGNNVVIQPQRAYVDDVDGREVECAGISDQDELRLDWLRCIRSREPNRSTVDLGLRHMIVVDLATRSLWEGKAFGFDAEALRAVPI